MTIPLIAITMGDAAGVGPELCLRVAAEPAILQKCTPVIFGNARLLERVATICSLPIPRISMNLKQFLESYDSISEPVIIDSCVLDAKTVLPGALSADCGKAAYDNIIAAIECAQKRLVAAVVTAPINKKSLSLAGISYPGHTEIFAEHTGGPRTCMMLTSEKITASLVTTHVGYSDVPALLSTERILDVIELTADAMRKIRGREPRLTVCGLNAHAGENGLFGQGEEENIILPAIEIARSKGIKIEGPLPPDTAFLPPILAKTDAHICMYHDQGLIPLKTIAFDSAVNTTLGLSIVRTSPDHGTAFDLAWKGKANPASLFYATELATKLSNAMILSE